MQSRNLGAGEQLASALSREIAATPKTHQNAVSASAFGPSFPATKDGGIFGDATNLGVGLTVCRDLCLRADGNIGAASHGTAWLASPATPSRRPYDLLPDTKGWSL